MEVLLALVLIALIFEDRCLKSVPLDLLMLFFLLCFLCDSFSYSYSFGITGALMAGFYFYGL
ncbi:MAG TPA: hypothetical protein VI959_00425, partial [Alphaproteobacteria bacterium]|nr:hypothetical protein [Alphaproteobacteria bacterium]